MPAGKVLNAPLRRSGTTSFNAVFSFFNWHCVSIDFTADKQITNSNWIQLNFLNGDMRFFT